MKYKKGTKPCIECGRLAKDEICGVCERKSPYPFKHHVAQNKKRENVHAA